MLPDPNDRSNTEFPVAAAVVKKGEQGRLVVVATATNACNEKVDSTAHAELEAIRKAGKIADNKNLDGYFLLSTLEPCMMCVGGIENTELSGVIYGAAHEDVAGRHAAVNGEFKPFRVSGNGFNAKDELEGKGIDTVSGFMRDEVVAKLTRTPVNWREYYTDPDT